MRIALIGQHAFGKAVLDAFLARGDEIAGVFCAPEPPGSRPDLLRQAALDQQLQVFQFASLKSPQAEQALRGLEAELGVMAYVLQFAPQSFVKIPRHGTIQYHPSLLPKYRGPSAINWAIARGDSGAFTGSEITVVGRPKVSLAGPTWRIRFKRFGQAPFEGATLTYDARFTQTTDDVVIKRVNISLWGLRLASLVGFHRHAL